MLRVHHARLGARRGEERRVERLRRRDESAVRRDDARTSLRVEVLVPETVHVPTLAGDVRDDVTDGGRGGDATDAGNGGEIKGGAGDDHRGARGGDARTRRRRVEDGVGGARRKRRVRIGIRGGDGFGLVAVSFAAFAAFEDERRERRRRRVVEHHRLRKLHRELGLQLLFELDAGERVETGVHERLVGRDVATEQTADDGEDAFAGRGGGNLRVV